MLKSAFGGLSTGVRRQPQWSYVGVFMYSLAGWSFVLPAVYAPACADSRSRLMSGCLCIRWPGGAGSMVENVSYNSRGCRFLMFTGIVIRVPPRLRRGPPCYVSAENLSLYPRGTIPHIISNYPRAHYNAGLNTSAAVCRRRYLVSVRNLSIRCACNQTKVCRRKCSVRRYSAREGSLRLCGG